MKLGPVTKVNNRNKATSKKFDGRIMSSHSIALSKDTIFAKNCRFFAKNVDMSKITRALVVKVISNFKFLG